MHLDSDIYARVMEYLTTYHTDTTHFDELINIIWSINKPLNYNDYMKTTLLAFRKYLPTLNHKDRFKCAADIWKYMKSIE